MTTEKASTLRILKEGMGQAIAILESKGGEASHEVRAFLPELRAESRIPVLFLLTSLSFLEAGPYAAPMSENESEFDEGDGWTPADFLSHLRFDEGDLVISLHLVRGRSVFTNVRLTSSGELQVCTEGRGHSAVRWLKFVEGRTHLREVSGNEGVTPAH